MSKSTGAVAELGRGFRQFYVGKVCKNEVCKIRDLMLGGAAQHRQKTSDAGQQSDLLSTKTQEVIFKIILPLQRRHGLTFYDLRDCWCRRMQRDNVALELPAQRDQMTKPPRVVAQKDRVLVLRIRDQPVHRERRLHRFTAGEERTVDRVVHQKTYVSGRFGEHKQPGPTAGELHVRHVQFRDLGDDVQHLALDPPINGHFKQIDGRMDAGGRQRDEIAAGGEAFRRENAVREGDVVAFFARGDVEITHMPARGIHEMMRAETRGRKSGRCARVVEEGRLKEGHLLLLGRPRHGWGALRVMKDKSKF